MPMGGSTGHEYIYSLKNRLKEGSNRSGCIFPLLLLGVFSLIGLLINRDLVNPLLFFIPGVSLLLVVLMIIISLKDKRHKGGS
jgi:hypothetical protein